VSIRVEEKWRSDFLEDGVNRAALLLAMPTFASCGAGGDAFVMTYETANAPDDHWCPVMPHPPMRSENKVAPKLQFVMNDAGVGTLVPTDASIDDSGEMTRPRLVRAYPVRFNSGRPTGRVIAKCILTDQGNLRDCCIIKGLTGYNHALLDSISAWRYDPATFRGRPISLYYVVAVDVR
jgi:hypothetical protein